MGLGRGSRATKVQPTDSDTALDLTGPVWCEGFLEKRSTSMCQISSWTRRYFVLRRRTLAYYTSYNHFVDRARPLKAVQALFVRLPEGVVGDVRITVGTAEGTWLLQPNSRTEQCRWVNALWWALEPTRDELRMLQRHKALERKRRRMRRSSQTMGPHMPDSILVHKRRSERRSSQQGSSLPAQVTSRPASAGVGSQDAAIEAVATAQAARSSAEAEPAPAERQEPRRHVTFCEGEDLCRVQLLPYEDYVDRKQRRSLFYTVGDIMRFQRDADRPFDFLLQSAAVFRASILGCLRCRGARGDGDEFAGGGGGDSGGLTLRGSAHLRNTAGAAGGRVDALARQTSLEAAPSFGGSMRQLDLGMDTADGRGTAISEDMGSSPHGNNESKRRSI